MQLHQNTDENSHFYDFKKQRLSY